MTRGAKTFLTVSAFIGAAVVFTFFFFRALDAQRNGWFSRISISILVGGAALSFLSCVAYWYLPVGRRPHQIPMGNEMHHVLIPPVSPQGKIGLRKLVVIFVEKITHLLL